MKAHLLTTGQLRSIQLRYFEPSGKEHCSVNVNFDALPFLPIYCGGLIVGSASGRVIEVILCVCTCMRSVPFDSMASDRSAINQRQYHIKLPGVNAQTEYSLMLSSNLLLLEPIDGRISIDISI